MMHDINLLPKKVKKISTSSLIIFILCGLAYVGVGGYFGYIDPMSQKRDLENKIADRQAELSSYTVTTADVHLLKEEVNNAKVVSNALYELKNNRLDYTDLLDDIEASTPEDVRIGELDITSGVITILAKAPTYRDAAKYIVKLRNLDLVTDAKTTTLTKEEGIIDNQEEEYHVFTIVAPLPYRDIVEELQAGSLDITLPMEGGVQ